MIRTPDNLNRLAGRINASILARNLVLAACGLLVLGCLVYVGLNVFTRHGQVREVPDLRGMSVEEAHKAGRHASIHIEINDSLFVPAYPGGAILEQSPAPGAKVKSGRHIFVTINATHQKKVTIPYVTGFSLRQAKNNLELAGLEIKELQYRDDIATNYVLEERYDGHLIQSGNKRQAEIGSGITLIVGRSNTSATVQVPKLVGFTAHEAKSRLWEAGFNIGKITRDNNINALNEHEAHVYAQTATAGSRQELGSRIGFSLTLSEQKLKEGHTASDRATSNEAKARVEDIEDEPSDDETTTADPEIDSNQPTATEEGE